MSLLIGAIVIWSGSTLDIPSSWQLCDGTNGTPDLRNRFIIGAGDLYNVGATGGSANAIIPSHTHTNSMNSVSHTHTHLVVGGTGGTTLGHFRGQSGNTGSFTFSANGAHTHDVTLINAGAGETGVNKNLPPYFALCYIQQIS